MSDAEVVVVVSTNGVRFRSRRETTKLELSTLRKEDSCKVINESEHDIFNTEQENNSVLTWVNGSY